MFEDFWTYKTVFTYGISIELYNKQDCKNQRRIKITLGSIIQIGNVFQNLPNKALVVPKPPSIYKRG